MIRLIGVGKLYQTDNLQIQALQSLNLHIPEGDFVALMGPSGCGKSTLLNILGLLDYPTSGQFELFGTEVSLLNDKQRATLRKSMIGFVFQNFNLIDELTVYENVMLPLLYLSMSKRERKQRVMYALDDVSLSSRADVYPNQLSGGQQQRVAIARAIVSRPKLLLADEPTGHLDAQQGQEVMQLLSALNKSGTTIVMTTHNVRDAGYAFRVLYLLNGLLVHDRFQFK